MTPWQVIEADCVKAMAAMGEASVDAIVTDPPYHLVFMGRAWDCAPSPAESQAQHRRWADEALRVLKPGGHLLAFGGTRTSHRLACAIEDAGFEIRDTICWLYGSGFPKSLDVSKAIDRQRLDNPDWQRVGAWLRARRLEAEVSAKGLCAAIGAHGKVNHGGAVSNWENGFSCPTWDQWEAIREALSFGSEMDAEVWRLNGRKGTPGNERSDRVVSEPGGNAIFQPTQWVLNGGTPVLSEAERWQGWGTALKPAHEPVVVARKPLAGTVAGNVLEHGTGALNVDGCRIKTTDTYAYPNGPQGNTFTVGEGPDGSRTEPVESNPAGRWPANVVLDEQAAAMLDEQTGNVGAHADTGQTRNEHHGYMDGWGGGGVRQTHDGDSGGASRFFYVAKASSAERNAGLDGFDAVVGVNGNKWTDQDYRRGDNAPTTASRNVHPTVKPIALMRWLVRLVTPSGGLVLDPFVGSGTTGCAAMLEGFRFLGIERETEYAEIARARIAWWAEHPEGVELVDRLDAEWTRRAVADAGQLQMFGKGSQTLDQSVPQAQVEDEI